MAKIPFDIKYRPQIESGEYKVETRAGRPARIICWDRQHEDYPLIVLISCEGGEDCEIYTIYGKFYCSQELPAYDLIIITPEPELSEFENEVEEWWQKWASPPRNEYAVFNKEEFINLARHFYELGKNAKIAPNE